MDIKTLRAIVKLMRNEGVLSLKTQDVELQLSPEAILPARASSNQAQEEVSTDNPYANFPVGVLTPDQLAFYSAGGNPDEDPFKKDSN